MKAEPRQAMLQTITSRKKELKRNRDLFNSSIYAAEYVKQANIDMSIYEAVLPVYLWSYSSDDASWRYAGTKLSLLVFHRSALWPSLSGCKSS